MKTIRVEYGTTAHKFWGVCGLIMHAAICSASQKTMPSYGIVCSKLTAMSKVVNVQSEERSISLVARLRNDCFPKFLSRSFNGNIKTSHLKGFFILNSSHAQSIMGMAALLKGRLIYLGFSVSKFHVFSPNLHFSLLTKTRGVKPNLMLKRILAERQSSLTEKGVNFEEDLGIKNSSAIEVMKIDHHDSQADLSERLDTKESLETENIQRKIENEQKSSLLEIEGMQGKELFQNEMKNLKKIDKDVDLFFRDVFQEDLPETSKNCDEAESIGNTVFEMISRCYKIGNDSVQNISNWINSIHKNNQALERVDKGGDQILSSNQALSAYYNSIGKTSDKLEEKIEKFQQQQRKSIETMKNKFAEANDLLHKRFHKLFPNAFNKLLDLLKDKEIEYCSNQLWMQFDSEDQLKDALKDLDGAIQYEENLGELKYELCQLGEACLDIENNHGSLKERINSYIALVASMETLRDKINLGISSQKIIFEQKDLEILMKIDKLSKRVEIFLDIASTIIFMGVKGVNKLKDQHLNATLSVQQAKLREMKETAQIYLEIFNENTAFFSDIEE